MSFLLLYGHFKYYYLFILFYMIRFHFIYLFIVILLLAFVIFITYGHFKYYYSFIHSFLVLVLIQFPGSNFSASTITYFN